LKFAEVGKLEKTNEKNKPYELVICN